MPFQSEKQRRFLWAEHPEIAKRWAHKYPESNKNLPMYADKQKDKASEKQAVLGALERALNEKDPTISQNDTTIKNSDDVKRANSGMVKVDIPRSDKPTYAGEEREKGELDEEGNPKCDGKPVGTGEEAISAIFGKLSAVLARPLREAMEAQKAQEEGREPMFVPENLNIRRYSVPSPVIAPPMGMTAPTVANPTPMPVQQPGQPSINSANSSPVGGGSNPQHNPIQAFGPLGAKGQLNGNAAFGVKNSPDSLKTAGIAWGGKDWSYTPKGSPVGVNAGYTYLGGVLPIPHIGVDIGTGGAGLQLGSGLDAAQSSLAGLRTHQRAPGFSSHESSLPSMWKMLANRMKKEAAIKAALGGNKLPNWYGSEGLIEGQDGHYRYGVHHAVGVRDQAPGFLSRLFSRSPYVLRDDVPKYKKRLKQIRGLQVYEDPDELHFSHSGTLKPEMRQLIEAALAKHAEVKISNAVASPSILDDSEAKTAQACSCGCGDTVKTCKCGPDCKCRQPGGSCYKAEKSAGKTPAWQRSEGKNEEGGLNEKGRKSYERETGGNLKAPVTEKNPSGERAKRQNSFCSRMCGMKRVNTGSKTKSDPDSRINKSLRKWNCKCSSAQDLINIALGADS